MFETEASLIGMIFLDEAVLDVYRLVGVRSRWFSVQFYGLVYDVCCKLRNRKQAIDLAVLKSEIKEADWDSGLFKTAMETAITTATAEVTARELQKQFFSRGLLKLFQEASANLMNQQDPLSVATDMAADLEKVINHGTAGTVKTTYQAAEKLMRNWEEIESGKRYFLPTGYEGLDRVLGGGVIRNGFYIIAARPGCGKTALAVNITDRMAKAGNTVLFVSLEMEAEMLVARRLALRTGLSASVIMNCEMDKSRKSEVINSIPGIYEENIFYVDAPRVGVQDVQFYAAATKADVVVIDYLGLLRHGPGKSLYERVTETSKDLKAAARSLGVPILCLTQLNREVEARGDGKPRLSDLRDSGQIEQDADGVVLLHRLSSNDEGVNFTALNLIVAKNRHGKLGTVTTGWNLRSGEIKEEGGMLSEPEF